MQKSALYTAAALFAAMALVHWVRFFLGTEIVVGGVEIPVATSLPVGIALALLALWMILAARRS